jgi:SET domain-containing protein
MLPADRTRSGQVLEVRESRRGGRGLFATEAIDGDVLLMSAPVLLIPPEERGPLEHTVVDAYVYEWDDDGTAALVLGVSSMCNHAADPNAYLWLVPDQQAAELWSLRPIAAGEEVTVSYRASGDPDAPLWFDVVE